MNSNKPTAKGSTMNLKDIQQPTANINPMLAIGTMSEAFHKQMEEWYCVMKD
jgi:hypothetical protein